MADRVIKVSMVAVVAGYISGVQRATRETEKTRDAVASATERFQRQKEAMEITGRTAVAFGAIVAAGIAIAIKRYADFDQAMSQVIATGDDARQNQDALRQAALEAGAATVFSATESANAIEELAKAGVSANDILGGGLSASLNLAAAGGLEVADAAQIAATAMTQFNLRGDQMNHVADLLAAGAGNAQGDVTDLSQALNQAGLVASATGLSIEETTAGLSAFAAAGLLGSDAGTSFKAMLQRLTPQSAEAQAKMDELGISAYDAQGNFIGLANFAGNLQAALADLTPEQRQSALATIFGSDAVRAATILYDQGADGIRNWTATVDQSGYAAQVAATRLDNLKGDVEKLSGSLDSFFISLGSAADGPLRGVVQGLTSVVDLANQLPAPLQAVALGAAVAVAGVALLGGGALIAVPKIAALKLALTELNITGSSVRTGLGNVVGFLGGPWGAALTLATVAVGVFIGKQAEMAAGTREAQDSLDAATGAVTDYTREIYARKLAEQGVFDVTTAAGIAQEDVVAAIVDGGAAMASYREQMQAYINDGHQFSIENTNASNAVLGFRTEVERAGENFRNVKAATQDATQANADSVPVTQTAAEAYLDASSGASDLDSQLRQLIDTINAANGLGRDAISSNIAYRDALAGVDDVIRQVREGTDANADGVADYTATLDQATQAGRDNLGMLTDLAGQAQAAADAQLAADGNTQAYMDTIAASRTDLIQRAQDLGYSADEAQRFADRVLGIPTQVQVNALVETTEAQRKIADLKNSLEAFRNSNYGVNVTAYVRSIDGRAAGGIIPGPPSKVDNRVYRVATGEFIVNAAQTQRHRALLEHINAGTLPGYAGGGYVQPQYAAPTYSPRINVASPSLEGLAITGRLEIGGDGLARIVDGRIVAASRDRAVDLATGKWRDA